MKLPDLCMAGHFVVLCTVMESVVRSDLMLWYFNKNHMHFVVLVLVLKLYWSNIAF